MAILSRPPCVNISQERPWTMLLLLLGITLNIRMSSCNQALFFSQIYFEVYGGNLGHVLHTRFPSFKCNPAYTEQIATNICTWHDSRGVMAYAKCCNNMIVRNRITITRIVHGIWVVMNWEFGRSNSKLKLSDHPSLWWLLREHSMLTLVIAMVLTLLGRQGPYYWWGNNYTHLPPGQSCRHFADDFTGAFSRMKK